MDLDQVGGTDLGPVFKITNIAVSAFTVLAALTQFFFGFREFLISIYMILLGGFVGYLEFKVPAKLYDYASFFFSFLGRGVLYVFLGILILHASVFRVLAGLIVIGVGIAYIVLEFIPSVEPPSNMQNGGSMLSDDVEDVI